MPPPDESQPAPDLADQVDAALAAFWQGDTGPLERLLPPDQPDAPPLNTLFQALTPDSAAPAIGLTCGSEVDGHRIIREIDRGGMGIVFEAEEPQTHRRVALKVLRGPYDEHAVELFLCEVRALAKMRHPSVAPIFRTGRTPQQQCFFTMDLVPGVRLNQFVRERAVPLRARLQLFLRICDAVQHAHAQGVIHRDLKPSNILVEADGHPKIVDFGLARVTAADATLDPATPDTGQIAGTWAYMSPEQARGQTDCVDARSDVYSLGVILFELLTDRLPYRLRTDPPRAVVDAICHTTPLRPRALNRHVAQDLETIVLKTLEKEPALRYPTVQHLADDLRRFLAQEPVLARRSSIPYLLRRKLAKYRLRIGLAAGAIGLGWAGLATGAWWMEQAARKESLRQAQHTTEQRLLESDRARQGAVAIQRDLEAGRVGLALGAARSLLDAHPEFPEAWLVWAQAQFRLACQTDDLKPLDAALRTLRAALDRDPADGAAAALIAEMLRHSNDPTADQWLATAHDHPPQTPEAWYVRSFATLDSETALPCLQKTLDLQPTNTLAWMRLAHLSLHSGHGQEALEAARRCVALGGESRAWLAEFERQAFASAGDYSQIIADCTRAIAQTPADTALYRRRAVAYLCLREYDQAIADYSRELELGKPTEGAWAHYHRATPLWITGQHALAAADYRAFFQKLGYRSYGDARLFLVLSDQARLLRLAGQTAAAADAEQEARSALAAALRGVDPGSWLEKILKCLAGQRTPEQLLDDANLRDPEAACEAYYYAGEACLGQHQPAAARLWLQKCVQQGILFDQDEPGPDPMNEYHLACWRLEQLDADESAFLPSTGD